MARVFDDSTSNFLRGADPNITAPLTMVCWYTVAGASSGKSLMTIEHATTAANWFRLTVQGNATGNPLRAQVSIIGTAFETNSVADAEAGGSAYAHAGAVFAGSGGNATAASTFLNGTKATGGTGTLAPSLDILTIGRRGTTQPHNGNVAWPAIWDVALSDGEMSALNAGAHPLLIRPESLVFFAGDMHETGGEIDIIGGNDLTENGTVAAAESNLLALGGAVGHNSAAPAGTILPQRSYPRGFNQGIRRGVAA